MIADTGPIVAWLNTEDQYHDWARTLTRLRPWLTLESCLAEASWNLGNPARVAEIVELGLVEVVPLDTEDWQRIAQLARKFADLDIDLVDFSVVRLSEKLRRERIATVDKEHFSILRRFERERLPVLLPGGS
jgi:predicted nucleic acid-binding protein